MVRRRPLIDRDLLRPSTTPWAAENKDYHRFDLSHAPSGEPTSRSPPTGHARLTERGDSSQTPASRFFLMIFHPPLAKSNGPGLPVTHIRKSDTRFPNWQGISLHESLVLKAKVPRFQRFRRRRSIPASRHQDIESHVRICFRATWHLLRAEPSSAHDETASTSCDTVIAMAPVGRL
jgi:hypothetical protein